MAAHELSLAYNKTEILILTKKTLPTILPLRAWDVTVETKPVVRYLRVLIGTKMSFFHQILHTADKAANAVTGVQSLLLYGAEV